MVLDVRRDDGRDDVRERDAFILLLFHVKLHGEGEGFEEDACIAGEIYNKAPAILDRHAPSLPQKEKAAL